MSKLNQNITLYVTDKGEKIFFTVANNYISVYPVKLSFSHIDLYFFNSFRGQRPLYEAWQATFGPQATGWEPQAYILNLLLQAITLTQDLQTQH